MTNRSQVVHEAYSWLGTPYHHHGRVKGVGVDCVQLLCAVFETVGLIEHVETGFYPVDWHLHHSEQLFSNGLLQVSKQLPDGSQRLPGDVFVFKYGRTFSHGAIYCDDDTDGNPLFIHSYLGQGVILSGLHEEPLCGRTYQHWSVF